MTKTQLLKLLPEFSVGGGITMVDWFEVTEGAGYFGIRSGLRHADGKTKSPYYYEALTFGKNSKKECLVKFSEWWNSINK